jgi:DNA repair exonuclease SbcCD nuclease subunit
MILGDLFDTVNVSIHDVLKTYQILKGWCILNPDNTLYLVAGNHDLSKSSNVLSSFDFLCALLQDVGVKVCVIKQPMMTPYGYVIPHLPNQSLFDEALALVPACAVLFLHCNYDSKFAAQSDQSLCLSKEQAEALPVSSILLGHEHSSRRTGKVYIPGNQIASSVSDWLGQRAKMFATVDNGVVTLTQCPPWVSENGFTELDWQSLVPTPHKFIRVTGTATADQAGAVVTAISKYRQASPAFVITNGVRIASSGDSAVFEQALDGVQAFSIMSALREFLTPEEITKIEGLANA